MKTLTLEYHSPEEGFMVFGGQDRSAHRTLRPLEERAAAAFLNGLDLAALPKVWRSEHSFATTDGVQLRGAFYEVSEADRGALEQLFVALFPDATSSESFRKNANSPHKGLTDFVLGSSRPFDIWITWPEGGTRLTGVSCSVPEWSQDRFTFEMEFRRVRLMVFGGVCLVFFLREEGDKALELKEIANRIHELERRARGSYSSGSDGNSPGDIANKYVSAILDRMDEGTLRIEEALDAWEVTYYSDVIEGRPDRASPDVEALREIRASTAEIRTQMENLSRRDLQDLKDWKDRGTTTKSIPSFKIRIDEIQARLQDQRIGVQDALALVATASTAGLLRVAEEGRQQSERLQRMGTLIASFVLVPGLLATLYASGIEVPGGSETTQRTAWLGGLMLGGAVATTGLISLYERGSRKLAHIFGLTALTIFVGLFILFGSSPNTSAPLKADSEAVEHSTMNPE